MARTLRSAVIPVIARRSAWVLVLITLVGCSVLKPPRVADVKTYVFEPVIAPAPATPAQPAIDNAVIVVAEPRSQAGYATTRMAYMKRDYALDYFANSQWADTPARMLQPLLVAALEATGRYAAVLRAPAGIAGALRVDTEVVHVEQLFVTQPSRMRIALRVQVINPQRGQVLGTRLFDVNADAPTDDAYGGVRAANQMLAPLLKDVAAFCVELSTQSASRLDMNR